jgi:SAM-dependent methyltransferase
MSQATQRLDLVAVRDQITMLGIAEGFFQSRVLFALTRLNIFEIIGTEGASVDDIAAQLHGQPATLSRLLNAGVVMKLLKTENGRDFTLTSLSRSVLLPGETYLGNWIRNLRYFDDLLSDLDQAVLTSRPTVDPATHLGANAEQTRDFTLAMHDYAVLRGKELADYLDTTGCQTLLDLGCGPGTYSFFLGATNPELQLHLLDLPEVLEVTREVQKRYPLKNSVHYIPADAVNDEIPGEFDIILISNMLHILGPEASCALLQRVGNALKPGGSIVIQAQFLRDDGRGDRWPVLLDLLMLCTTDQGKNHSVQETSDWLRSAGFSRIEFRRMGILNTNSFLRAYRT